MGEAVAGLVVIVVLAALAGGVALWVDRSRRQRAQSERSAVREATWEVAEQGARANSLGGTVTRVFVRRVTAAGDEVDRIEVASVPNGATDWGNRMLEARAAAAQRAALLNAQP